MRFTLTLEDADGNQICMTDPASTGIMTSEIEGLSPPAGTLSTAGYAGSDGSYLTNAYVDKRNIVISFQIRGASSTIEERRQNLYDIVQPGQYIKVYYKTTRRNVYTEGYVESVTVSNFSAETGGQISILCPDIYWHAQYSDDFTFDPALPITGTAGAVKSIGSATDGYPAIHFTATIIVAARLSQYSDCSTSSYTFKLRNGSSVDAELYVIYESTGTKLSYQNAGGETFVIPAGGYFEFDTATMLKYARVYDSDGKHAAFLMQTGDATAIPEMVWGENDQEWVFIFKQGITDDELAEFASSVSASATAYANYLGV